MMLRDVMNTDVKTIGPDSTIKEAAREMNKYRVGSLIVVKESRLVGIITERDILSKVVAEALDASKTCVKDVMTKRVIMMSPEKDVEDAAEVMMQHGIKKLPIVEKDKLIGIITATDICATQPKMMEQISSLLLLPKKKRVVAG